MKFNVTVDKKAEAVIDRGLCINCGECREICPTQAIGEYRKAAVCMNAAGEGSFSGTLADAKKQAVDNACSNACPLGIVPQTVAALVEQGELEEAAKHIWGKTPFPGICSSVCDHFCRESCQRTVFGDEPLDMKALERFVLKNTEKVPFKYIKKYNEKVAVIGGGPAGISAAFYLAKSGYPVTIFEKDRALGGALRWGIPSFRLDKDAAAEEIERIVAAGIDVRCGIHIGEDVSLDELWEDDFRACLIAVGESYGIMPEINGADAEGVYDSVKVMRQVIGGDDEGVVIGDDVVIVGAGGAAADLARVLAAMGKDVVCVAGEQEEDLAMGEELAAAVRSEGVDLRCGTRIGQIIAEDDKVKAVELIKEQAANHFCDTVIFAAGQKSVAGNICNAETYPDGKLRIDDHYRTNKEMIFACGDITGETGSVVEAAAAGKDAAIEIDRALHGTAESRRECPLQNAPDGLAVYPENVRMIRPQREEKILMPIEDEEELFSEEQIPDGLTVKVTEPVEDIMAVIRAAGIEEEMSVFEFSKDAKKVAVIGGGIAGVTAAIALARRGICPVIFEKESALGGSCRWLATEKRLDKDVLIRELKKVEASGIEVVYNVAGGIKPNIDRLFKMGYEAILFACGDNNDIYPELNNMDAAGVFDMAALMGKLIDEEIVAGLGEKILVVGGDEMTFDIARKLRENHDEVTVLAPWSRGSLQTKTGAVDAAIAEGVNLVTGAEVVEIEEKDGKVYNAVFKVIEKGYTIKVPCDSLIIEKRKADIHTLAIRNLKLDIDDSGSIAVDHKLASSIKGVFAIGKMDMSAPDAGRAGAAAIENYFEGVDSYISKGAEDKAEMPNTYEVIEGAKQDVPSGREAGRKVLEKKQALIEASRCIGCGYHTLDPEMCMGCGICVKVCPVNAITMMPAAEIRDQGKEV